MLALFVGPLLITLAISFGAFETSWSLRAYKDLWNPVYLKLLWFSLELAFLVTIGTAILGYPIAYLMVHGGGVFARFMGVSLFIALWLSLLARTFGWIIMLQRNGVVNDTLQLLGLISGPLDLVFNRTGVYIGMLHVQLPFMVAVLVPALKAIDLNLVRTSLSLGASPFRAFRTVYFPLSLPGLTAGIILVFTMSFGVFVTPAILGGGRSATIILAVRDQLQVLGDLPLASATSMVLLVICALLLMFYDRLAGVDNLYRSRK